MAVVYRMRVRDMLPEVINKAARAAGRSLAAEEHSDIQLKKVVTEELPTEGDAVTVHPGGEPRYIESTSYQPEGDVEIWLEVLDTDEVADDEGVVVEELLAAGWQIDFD